MKIEITALGERWDVQETNARGKHTQNVSCIQSANVPTGQIILVSESRAKTLSIFSCRDNQSMLIN